METGHVTKDVDEQLRPQMTFFLSFFLYFNWDAHLFRVSGRSQQMGLSLVS